MEAAQQSPHIIPLVRKLQDAGVPPPAAEAIGETMEQLATKAELKEMEERIIARTRLEIHATIAEAVQKLTLAMVAVVGVGVAIIAILVQ